MGSGISNGRPKPSHIQTVAKCALAGNVDLLYDGAGAFQRAGQKAQSI